MYCVLYGLQVYQVPVSKTFVIGKHWLRYIGVQIIIYVNSSNVNKFNSQKGMKIKANFDPRVSGVQIRFRARFQLKKPRASHKK